MKGAIPRQLLHIVVNNLLCFLFGIANLARVTAMDGILLYIWAQDKTNIAFRLVIKGIKAVYTDRAGIDTVAGAQGADSL